MKGIAVETIIKVALILLVVSLLVYWIIMTAGNKQISVEQCRTMLVNWCKDCVLKGWKGALPWSNDLLICVNNYVNILGINPFNVVGNCASTETRTECAKFGIT